MKIRFEKPPAAPDVHNDLTVRYAAAKRQFPRIRWYLLVAAILSVPFFFIIRILLGFLTVEAPAFVMMPQAALISPVNGRVESIATPGSKVVAGETLAVISLFHVETVPSPSDQRSAEDALELAEKVLVMRRSQLDEVRRLYTMGAATEADLANAQSLWLAALSQVHLAEQTLENHTQLPPAKATNIIIKSPFSGIVASQIIHPGVWVTAGSSLLTVTDEKRIWIRAYLNPQDARYAKVGTHAVLEFGDKTRVKAKVTSIGQEAFKTPKGRISPLSTPSESIILTLQPLTNFPSEYKIYNLPLTVLFSRF